MVPPLALDRSPSPEAPGAAQRRRAALRFDLIALAGFGTLLAAVKAGRTADVDVAITLRVQRRTSPAFDALMRAVSWPGFPPQSRLIPPAVVVALFARGRRSEAVFEGAAWGTALLATVVKAFTRRQRPLPPNVRVVVAELGGSSFPSGHVLTYVGVYGFAAHLANTLEGPPWRRGLLLAPLLGLVGLVGPSRIAQGHHWPTDVLASYLLGFAYIGALASTYEGMARREPR